MNVSRFPIDEILKSISSAIYVDDFQWTFEERHQFGWRTTSKTLSGIIEKNVTTDLVLSLMHPLLLIYNPYLLSITPYILFHKESTQQELEPYWAIDDSSFL